MNSKAYSARNVNLIQLSSFLKDRDDADLWVGVDVGKEQMHVVLIGRPMILSGRGR